MHTSLIYLTLSVACLLRLSHAQSPKTGTITKKSVKPDVEDEHQLFVFQERTYKVLPAVLPMKEDTRRELFDIIEAGPAEKHYDLGEYVGEGAFSKVYCGKVKGDKGGRKMAIKVMPLNGEEGRARLAIQEVKALGLVKHADIAQFHSARFTADKSTIYLAMEYVPGFNMYSWMEKRANQLREGDAAKMPMIMPSRSVKHVAKRLFLALQATHRAGVAHHDLDTSNIRITNPEDPNGVQVTIIDFNGSKIGGENIATAMEEDIIRLAMVVLELGMKPQGVDVARLAQEHPSEYFGGALISVPRWVSGKGNNVAIARQVLKMSQKRANGSIIAYPEVIEFVGHVLKLDKEHQLTVDNVLRHPFFK